MRSNKEHLGIIYKLWEQGESLADRRTTWRVGRRKCDAGGEEPGGPPTAATDAKSHVFFADQREDEEMEGRGGGDVSGELSHCSCTSLSG